MVEILERHEILDLDELVETFLGIRTLLRRLDSAREATMIQFTDEQHTIEIEATGDEQRDLTTLNEKLADVPQKGHKRALLLGPDGEKLVLPESLFRLLREAAMLLSHGARVVVAPIDNELSTQEAADILNVSRPFLVGLLDQGEIPFTKTGRYRKVRFGDVSAYKARRNARRGEMLAEMMRKNREAGIYDKPDTGIPETR
ncbi:MAG: excisionase family DNA-binding protein [Candidatus Aquilonibacter sp.]